MFDSITHFSEYELIYYSSELDPNDIIWIINLFVRYLHLCVNRFSSKIEIVNDFLWDVNLYKFYRCYSPPLSPLDQII